MPVTPCEEEIPPLEAPWDGLKTVVRFCWKSKHPRIQIHYISIIGDKVFPPSLDPVEVENGKEVLIAHTHVPYGARETWCAAVRACEILGPDLKGLTIAVEFYDACGNGKGKREVIASDEEVPLKELKPFEKRILAPKQGRRRV